MKNLCSSRARMTQPSQRFRQSIQPKKAAHDDRQKSCCPFNFYPETPHRSAKSFIQLADINVMYTWPAFIFPSVRLLLIFILADLVDLSNRQCIPTPIKNLGSFIPIIFLRFWNGSFPDCWATKSLYCISFSLIEFPPSLFMYCAQHLTLDSKSRHC